MARHTWPLRPTGRLLVTGRLVLDSALHVGGGNGTTSLTDDGVLRHADGRPFIPGSSLKGVLRSHAERLLQAEGFRSAGDPDDPIRACFVYDGAGTDCPSVLAADPTIPREDRLIPTRATREHLEGLCHTCTLFGSPILAGKVRIPDLEVDDATWNETVEIRDGVGIDRDRGVARDGVKYDYEVVPSGTTFGFALRAESPTDDEVAVLALLLGEMRRGHVAVGGKTTRGLGACRLTDLAVARHDFTTRAGLRAALLGTPAAVDDAEGYLNGRVDALFATAA